MNPVWIIEKKRDGEELTDQEIREFVHGVLNGSTTDYQATAFLMAVYFKGMSLQETVALTKAMLESGERYDLSHIPGAKVDKHSTGGVGDKVSLILAPLAAACGLKVPMMSGRGLGHSGGTLDKLESIKGFNVNLAHDRFEQVLKEVGVAMIGQTQSIAPIDKKLYALRDVTGTVECIPLIVASILSKKLAEGSEALVLDVKTGSGAFMKTREQSRKLAKALNQVAKKMGLPCRALVTDMNQPLGYAVGNALEMIESIQILKNEKAGEFSSADLKELTIQLCAHMLELGKVSRTVSQGRALATKKLNDGSAWKVFQHMVKAQGGDLEQVLNTNKFPKAAQTFPIKAHKKGYISRMETEVLGKALVELGGGRKKASDTIDPSVGMLFHKKLGARVQPGDTLVTVHASENTDVRAIEMHIGSAIEISGVRKPVPKLVFEQF